MPNLMTNLLPEIEQLVYDFDPDDRYKFIYESEILDYFRLFWCNECRKPHDEVKCDTCGKCLIKEKAPLVCNCNVDELTFCTEHYLAHRHHIDCFEENNYSVTKNTF